MTTPHPQHYKECFACGGIGTVATRFVDPKNTEYLLWPTCPVCEGRKTLSEWEVWKYNAEHDKSVEWDDLCLWMGV